MKFDRSLKALPALLLLVLTPSLRAQDLGFRELLQGTKLPLNYKLAELPAEFRPVSIKMAGASSIFDALGGMFGMFMGMAKPGESEPGAEEGLKALMALESAWTTGETVQMYNHLFLVTYTPNPSGALGVAPPTDEPEVYLRLVRVDAIQAIAPIPNLKKEDLASALTKLATPESPTMAVPDLVQTSPDERAAELAAAKSATMNHAKQLGLAMQLYATDWDDVLPYAQSSKTVRAVIYPYVKDVSTFETRNPNGGELVFNLALGGASTASVPTDEVLLYDSRAWPDGSRVVAYADGRARSLSASEWASAKASLTRRFKRIAKKPLPATYGLDMPPNRR
jgi:hypothetical protein